MIILRSGLYGGCIKTSEPAALSASAWLLKMCVWSSALSIDETQNIFYWSILADLFKLLALILLTDDSRDQNQVFDLVVAAY